MDRLNLYDSAQDLLVCELEKIVKNETISAAQLDFMDKIVDIIKDLDEVSMNEEERMGDVKGGYSQRSMPRYYYGRGNSYRDGNMGYSRRNYPINDRSYGKDNSSEEMLNYLYLAHENASNEEERKRIKRMIDEIENAK